MDEIVFMNALNQISFLGPLRLKALLDHFGSARAAWTATGAELDEVPALQGLTGRLTVLRRKIDPFTEWQRLEKAGVKVLSFQNEDYPLLLQQIHRPPSLLYYLGSWQQPELPISIVGSRRCTFYGREVTRRLARELAEAGFTVVSGMALGIDSEAHLGALEGSGRTLAVLGCGPDICYPPGNANLMKRIVASGAVLSEFPLGATPLPQHFPQRNRVISGLTLGTVVVEAPERSGALITAHYALEQNREVFAVPGNIGSPYSKGCHRLLREGARLVESITDILEELSVEPVMVETAAGHKESGEELPAGERRLLELIAYQPLHIDEIIRLSGETAARVSSMLLSLELKGCLKQLPGKYFVR